MQYIGYIIVIQFLKCPLSRDFEIWFEVHSCKMACLSVCLTFSLSDGVVIAPSCQLQSSWLKVISLFQEYQTKGHNRIVVDQACLQGAASPEELVKRLGGSRVITKILIANNGIAAVSWISLEFL